MQEKHAEEFLLQRLKEFQAKAHPNLTFDILIQRSDGSHRFDMVNQVVMKVYSNITNIIAKISCGPECDKNSILVQSITFSNTCSFDT